MKTYGFCGDGSEYAIKLSRELESVGVQTVFFTDSEELKNILDEGMYAVVLVNPYFHLVRAVRAVLREAGGWFSRIPLLAALGDVSVLEEVETLKLVDDFVVVQGGADELIARVEVLALKRGGQGNVVQAGELLINLDAHQVFLGGKPVDFTYKEFELLKTMAATPGRAYSREELLRNIWGYDYFGGTRTVDVHVRRIRAKIEGSSQHIETVHGVGYRFVSR